MTNIWDEHALYPYHRENMEGAPPGMYLEIFHGRNDPTEDMDDWGFHGGYVGPLKFAHTTYGSDLKLLTADEQANVYLRLFDDMLLWRDAYYGDWSVFMHAGESDGERQAAEEDAFDRRTGLNED